MATAREMPSQNDQPPQIGLVECFRRRLALLNSRCAGAGSLAAAPAPVTAAYRGLSAADDEPEEPRYNSCGASAASFRSLAAEADQAEEPRYIQIPPLMRANAGTLMLG